MRNVSAQLVACKNAEWRDDISVRYVQLSVPVQSSASKDLSPEWCVISPVECTTILLTNSCCWWWYCVCLCVCVRCDELLTHDGAFLVRESPSSPGQYVLSGDIVCVCVCVRCDELLTHDGAFLVRESPSSPGQYVLSGDIVCVCVCAVWSTVDSRRCFPSTWESVVPGTVRAQWWYCVCVCVQCDELLTHDGAFLVRESPSSPGQYVLSGGIVCVCVCSVMNCWTWESVIPGTVRAPWWYCVCLCVCAVWWTVDSRRCFPSTWESVFPGTVRAQWPSQGLHSTPAACRSRGQGRFTPGIAHLTWFYYVTITMLCLLVER